MTSGPILLNLRLSIDRFEGDSKQIAVLLADESLTDLAQSPPEGTCP
jgi:hypothetical protein